MDSCSETVRFAPVWVRQRWGVIVPLVPGAEPFTATGGSVGALLIHGFTGSPYSMRPWGEFLADAGLAVEIPRLPGHGTRWQDMNLTRWDDWYAEVDRSLTVLKSRCEHVVVMGLSMGGSLALRTAEQRGAEIAGIVLVNPAVHSERADRHLLPLVQRVIPSFPGIGNDIRKPGQDERGYDRIPLKAAYSLSKLWELVRNDISRVTTPILLLHSATDHVVEPSNSAWILANVRSTDVTEIVLHDSYHVATLDNDAPLIFSSSLEFTARVTGASLPNASN